MNCADSRHRILTADLAVLRGDADASLRDHLAGCAACAAEASVVVGGTARLKGALLQRQRQPAARWSRGRRIAVSLIPVALAAEITLLAVLANRDAAPTAGPARLDDSVYSIAPVNAVSRDSEVVIAPVAIRRSKPLPGAPRKAAATPPVQVAETSAVIPDASMSQVRVTVQDHQRAAIFATSNPKITLVLLSRGDSL